MKILIVDDSAFMRRIIKNVLVKEGKEDIVEAGSGEEAIEKYKESSPGLVFMDIILPGINGIEALRNIKTINSEAKVVMVTSVGGQEKIINEAISAGANDFVTKPFKAEEIKKVLDKYV